MCVHTGQWTGYISYFHCLVSSKKHNTTTATIINKGTYVPIHAIGTYLSTTTQEFVHSE